MKLLLYPFIMFGTILSAKYAWGVSLLSALVIKQQKHKKTDSTWAEYLAPLDSSKLLFQGSTFYMLCLGTCSMFTKMVLTKLSFRHAVPLSVATFLFGMLMHLFKATTNKDSLIQQIDTFKNELCKSSN